MNNSRIEISFRFRQLNKMQALTLCREIDAVSYAAETEQQASAAIAVSESNTKQLTYSALVALKPENIEAITMFYVRQGMDLSHCDILITATLANTTGFTLPAIVNQMLKHIDCPLSFSVLT
ncbi:hypothetical protein [Rheinheimera sp. 1928-s]|uniref:hypothetical protein n=1 Tax=Rheinheimera sp. 1928-s TaxID=3033803 RepID=UPI00261E138D|nr:hypothetical protein [Rheinheimera sp. 1928-s]MDF3126463.1 hypothetical protein [Rheinheimera sp. 1928-s]